MNLVGETSVSVLHSVESVDTVGVDRKRKIRGGGWLITLSDAQQYPPRRTVLNCASVSQPLSRPFDS
jgi:hypothetical protein